VRGEADATAEVGAGAGQGVPRATGRPRTPRPVHPGAATLDAVLAAVGAGRVRHVAVGGLAVPVGTPLPDVAVHVAPPPPAGPNRADGRRRPAVTPLLAAVVDVGAVVVRLLGGKGRAERKRSRRAGATGVLPLRLGRQAVALAVEPGQLLAELLA